MKWSQIVLVATALVIGRAAADCLPGDMVGPCLCMDGADGARSLECSDVIDGAEITAALDTIQVPLVDSLDIRDSPLLTVMPDAAFGTTAVKHIRFYTTGLTSLAPSVFTAPTTDTLSSLYIKHCASFMGFDPAVVGVLPALTELFVSSTGLTALTGALPPTALTYVDFTFNDIAQISSDYFAEAPELTIVLLGFNSLTTESLMGSVQTFAGPNDDLYLDLAFNDIDHGLVDVSFPSSSPRELIMSGNGITNLTEAGFGPVLDQMGAEYEAPYILLDNNPLACGCEMQWLMSHPYRSLVQAATCDNGQLVANLGDDDFTDCP